MALNNIPADSFFVFTSQLTDFSFSPQYSKTTLIVKIHKSTMVDSYEYVYEFTVFAVDGIATLHDVRSIIEDIMRSKSLATTWVTFYEKSMDGIPTMRYSYYMVYSASNLLPSDLGDEFLTNNFLTLSDVSLVPRDKALHLAFVMSEGESIPVNMTFTYYFSNGMGPYQVEKLYPLTKVNDYLQRITFYKENFRYFLSEALLLNNEAMKMVIIHSVNISVNKRSHTFFFNDSQQSYLHFEYINNFNVTDEMFLFAEVKEIPSTEQKEAVCNRQSLLYDRNHLSHFEMVLNLSSRDMAVQLADLCRSDLVKLHLGNTAYPIIFSKYDIPFSNEPGKVSQAKLTFSFASNGAHINISSFLSSGSRFTEQYKTQFN